MNRWLRVPMLVGALALIAVSGTLLGQKNAAYQWIPPARAASVQVSLIGDTASLLNRKGYLTAEGIAAANSARPGVDSAWAHDTTFKSGFDCCQFFNSVQTDTTRPLNVFGANYVGIRFFASDTMVSSGSQTNLLHVHYTGMQVSDDSTNWVALNLGATNNGAIQASLDTTNATLALNINRVGAYGWAREAKLIPVPDWDATSWIQQLGQANPPRFRFRYVRFILGASYTSAPDPAQPHHALGVQAIVERDDIGDKYQQVDSP